MPIGVATFAGADLRKAPVAQPPVRLLPERDRHCSQLTIAVARPAQAETIILNLQPIRSRVNHSDLLAEPILSRQNREVVGQFDLRGLGCHNNVVAVLQCDYCAGQEALPTLQLYAVAGPAPGILDSLRVPQGDHHALLLLPRLNRQRSAFQAGEAHGRNLLVRPFSRVGDAGRKNGLHNHR